MIRRFGGGETGIGRSDGGGGGGEWDGGGHETVVMLLLELMVALVGGLVVVLVAVLVVLLIVVLSTVAFLLYSSDKFKGQVHCILRRCARARHGALASDIYHAIKFNMHDGGGGGQSSPHVNAARNLASSHRIC